MAQQIPPPPPGFTIVNDTVPMPTPRQAAPRRQAAPSYNGPLPTSAEALFPSLIQQESGGRAGAVGPDTQWGNALGRTQMLPDTAREVSARIGVPFREDLLRGTSPEAAQYQDRLGLAYLQEGFERTGNARDALHYYHGGPDRRQWGPKTRAYADSILAMTARGEGQSPQMGETAQLTAGPVPPPPAGFEIVDGPAAPAPAETIRREVAAPTAPPPNGYQGGQIEFDPSTPYMANRTLQPGTREEGRAGRSDDELRAQGYTQSADGGWRFAPSPGQLEAMGYKWNPETATWDSAVGEDYVTARNVARDRMNAEDNGLQERIRALSSGMSGGFSDELEKAIVEAQQRGENFNSTLLGEEIPYSAGVYGDAYNAESKARQDRFRRDRPGQNFGLELAGGLAMPGMRAGGEFIAAGKGAERLARAGIVGGTQGAVYGAGNAEGSLAERAPEAAMGALTGAGVGVVGQGATDRLFAGAASPVYRDAARRLSNRGVDLTPGQMMAEIPVVGPTIRYLEDHLGGFNPLMAGVRRGQNEQVIKAAGNEALAPLANSGPAVRLPRDVRTGYQVSQRVRQVLGEAYDDVTARVNAVADQPLGDDLADLVVRAGSTLDDSSLARLDRILESGVTNRFGENGELSGQAFKDIEESLRIARDKLDRPGATLEAQETAEFVDEAREAVRNLIARQFPEEAARIRDINLGYANFKRIERAVSGAPGMARQGTPTPGELTQAVDQMSSTAQIANQTGLMQGLASDARAVLPSTVGDTGSGQKAVLGALGIGAAGGTAVLNPALAAGIVAGAIAYSKPALSVLNAVYRATDLRAANPLLANLARLAQRDPALLPYYEDALQRVANLERTDTQAGQPAPQSAPVPSAALQRVLQ